LINSNELGGTTWVACSGAVAGPSISQKHNSTEWLSLQHHSLYPS
jgi:hypothetical protein